MFWKMSKMKWEKFKLNLRQLKRKKTKNKNKNPNPKTYLLTLLLPPLRKMQACLRLMLKGSVEILGLCLLISQSKKFQIRYIIHNSVVQFLVFQSDHMCAFNPWSSVICVCPRGGMKSRMDYLRSFGPEKKEGLMPCIYTIL